MTRVTHTHNGIEIDIEITGYDDGPQLGYEMLVYALDHLSSRITLAEQELTVDPDNDDGVYDDVLPELPGRGHHGQPGLTLDDVPYELPGTRAWATNFRRVTVNHQNGSITTRQENP